MGIERGIESAIEYADQLLYERTGKHLSDLQSYIIQQSWQGKTYGQVATLAGYSEGHVKDVASQLWKILSEALGERITKGNLRSRLKTRIKRTIKGTPGSATVIAGIRGVQAQIDRSWESDKQGLDRPSLDGQGLDRQDAYPTVGSSFIGRGEALNALQTLTQMHRILVIQGEGGIGKTTLAQQYCQQFDQTLELLMAKETDNITPVESLVEEWLKRYFDDEPGRDFGITLSRLKHHLQTKRIVILIDNLEPALGSNGQFVEAHRHYVELLRMLNSTQATVLITSRDRLCEPGIKVHHYRLPGLTLEAWQQFFQTYGIDIRLLQNAEALAAMHSAYVGNAKAMEILCAAALEDFEGDLCAYWQENGADLLAAADLRNLVASQVNRLQQLDADAYRVFCRLGCYRYQEQARLRADAIAALMWDIEPAQQKQIIHSLRDRSLIEIQKGTYWLHPVSRAEAIGRLRQGKYALGEQDNGPDGDEASDWVKANRAAAAYWSEQTQSMTSVSDAIRALEAYYHLIAIADYDGAAAILLKSRHNQWNQFLPLASSLYRKGLLQPAIHTITQVLPYVTQARSELNNILGDAYWITGDIHQAIACQKKTLSDTANRIKNKTEIETRTKNRTDVTLNNVSASNSQDAEQYAYYLKMLTVDAHLSLGLYYIDLWELAQAAEQFEKVIALAADTPHQAWADKATVGLALVQAHQGQHTKATVLAKGVAERLTVGSDHECGRYAYFLQLLGQTFSQLHLFEPAEGLYQRALCSAEAGHYVQIKAKTLVGLAVLQRQRGNCLEAIALHYQAIELCQQIGAICDEAEAYLQLALTLKITESQAADQSASAQEHFERARSLLSTIGAPNQLERLTAASLST